MSLSGLHQYLNQHCRRYTGTVGRRQILYGALRSDDVYAKAAAYLSAAYKGLSVDFHRLTIAACQDLVSLRALSLHDSIRYRTFTRSRDCYVFMTGRRPSVTGRMSYLPA